MQTSKIIINTLYWESLFLKNNNGTTEKDASVIGRQQGQGAEVVWITNGLNI